MTEETPSLVFLYGDEALPGAGEPAVLPAWRIDLTRRGLPGLVRDAERAAPGVVTTSPPATLAPPWTWAQGHAVLVSRPRGEVVVPVAFRVQVPGGRVERPPREVWDALRNAAEACGMPWSWVTDGLEVERATTAFGAGIGARVRSVADRVSRGML